MGPEGRSTISIRNGRSLLSALPGAYLRGVAGTRGRKLRDVPDGELREEMLHFIGEVMNREPDAVRAETQKASLLSDDEFMRQLALK